MDRRIDKMAAVMLGARDWSLTRGAVGSTVEVLKVVFSGGAPATVLVGTGRCDRVKSAPEA